MPLYQISYRKDLHNRARTSSWAVVECTLHCGGLTWVIRHERASICRPGCRLPFVRISSFILVSTRNVVMKGRASNDLSLTNQTWWSRLKMGWRGPGIFSLQLFFVCVCVVINRPGVIESWEWSAEQGISFSCRPRLRVCPGRWVW